MINNSIVHVLESVLQYTALIMALVAYQWIKDLFPFSHLNSIRRSRRVHRIIKRGYAFDKLSILSESPKELRQRLNLTQEKFAEKMEVSTRTVQRWEKGSTRPQPHHYNRFQLMRQMGDHIDHGAMRIGHNIHGSNPWPLALLGVLLALGLLIFLALHFWLHII